MRYRPARAALAIWNASHAHSASDRRYAGYLGVMLAIMFVAPTVRALWTAASQPDVLHVLVAPTAPLVGGLCVGGLWTFALLLGGLRGPALRSPVLTYALARSGLSRISAFGGSVMRCALIVTVLTTGATGFIGVLLASHGSLTFGAAFAFAVLGTIIGVIATVAWLTGQAAPRAAGALATGVVILMGVSAISPAVAPFTPWGWIAAFWSSAASPAADPATAIRWLVPLAACALALASLTPWLLSRVRTQVLEGQSARWESSSVHAYGMDFSSAVSAYQGRPRVGRRVRAVRAGGAGRSGIALVGTFVFRDSVGATRSPGRLAAGAFGIAAASVLVTIASTAPEPGVALGALGAFAAVLAFAGLGPFTDGVRHAAAVAGDLPLYGVSDAQLLLLHAAFPVSAVLVLSGVVAAVSALALGISPPAPILCAATIGLCGVLARVSNALKGPLPLRLLTPIPTPEGDLSGAVRFIWSIDGVVLIACVGAVLPLAAHAPAWCAVACVPLVAVGAARWSRRRSADR